MGIGLGPNILDCRAARPLTHEMPARTSRDERQMSESMDRRSRSRAGLETVYRPSDEGILVPPFEVRHRDEEYDPSAFDVLAEMQDDHFWYRGRHRYILHALQSILAGTGRLGRGELRSIDLGGGCGGWVKYLQRQAGSTFCEIALADSSLRALRMARAGIADDVSCYQADLMNLGWEARWDVAFLLDVIEHLPDDIAALRQVHTALKPGGLLFVTVPALRCFWSYNDDLANHLRRYSRKDLETLALQSGFKLLRSQYFLFFASPLLYLARRFAPDLKAMTREDIRAHLARTHRTPPARINGLLDRVMALEEALGRHLSYPWGTSLLGVFGKADDAGRA
jgi:SAM-dependent methyltransferase